jgi:hypothetical protein
MSSKNLFGLNVNLTNQGLTGSASLKIPGLPGISLTYPFLSGVTNPPTNPNFSINNFIQNLNQHNETARTDKFDVLIIPPASVANYAGLSPAAIGRGLNLQCEISELPGRDIQMQEYTIHAFVRRVPHQNQYGSANFTFICTGDFWEKSMFDAWLDLMVPAQTGLVNYPLDANNNRNYECDIYCNQYDMTGTQIYQAQLVDAVPTSVSVLNQSWDNDAIHRLNVTFAFRKWVTVDTDYQTVTTFAGSNPQVLPSLTSGIINTIANSPIVSQDLRKGNAALNSAIKKLI